MKRRSALRFFAIGLAAFLSGCATTSGPDGAGGGLAPSKFEALVAPHRERAAVLEAQGDLREAFNEWKVALTIDPKDGAAAQAKSKLEERLDQAVASALTRARDALKRGVNLEARRHFLAVLALDPANRAAFEALQNEAKEVRVLSHTVRAGDTLASIAGLFYGDRSRGEVIWETNQLPPNPKLTPGMVLKIPEIPGVPFVRLDSAPKDPRVQGSPPPEPPKAEAVEGVPYVNPTLADAKEALERGEFVTALAGVDRFLAQNPRSADAVELKRNVLYQQGKVLFEQKKYPDSFAALNQLAKLAPKDTEVSTLLGSVRSRLVQDHYNQGIRLYREEKLAAAINEWRSVLQYDPNHEAAKKNIDQAERLLKGLQQRQQKQK